MMMMMMIYTPYVFFLKNRYSLVLKSTDYIYIYIYVCVCMCVCALIDQQGT